jgi:ABC-type uncharacterized transport system ATPase subunit
MSADFPRVIEAYERKREEGYVPEYKAVRFRYKGTIWTLKAKRSNVVKGMFRKIIDKQEKNKLIYMQVMHMRYS